MIGPFRKDDNEDELDSQIASVFVSMDEWGPDEEFYETLLSHQERLHKMKHSRARRVSPDTMAVVIGNLVGIAFVASYEHAHVWTTKAFSMILKNNQTSTPTT